MSQSISLQGLIEKVKSDLFSSVTGMSAESKIAYPIFLVEQVELELQVEFTYDANSEIKISVPQIIEGGVGAGKSTTSGHTMKITLKPIITFDEMRQKLKQDERMWNGIEDASAIALRKRSELRGEEE